MNKQFSFTSIGVQQWQAELYEQGTTAMQVERSLIEDDFLAWLFSRFVLHPDQQSFAQALGVPTHQIYAVAISNAIEEQTAIILEKEEDRKKDDDDYEHPKFSEMRYQVTTPPSVQTEKRAGTLQQQRELIFSLYYLDKQS